MSAIEIKGTTESLKLVIVSVDLLRAVECGLESHFLCMRHNIASFGDLRAVRDKGLTTREIDLVMQFSEMCIHKFMGNRPLSSPLLQIAWYL